MDLLVDLVYYLLLFLGLYFLAQTIYQRIRGWWITRQFKQGKLPARGRLD